MILQIPLLFETKFFQEFVTCILKRWEQNFELLGGLSNMIL